PPAVAAFFHHKGVQQMKNRLATLAALAACGGAQALTPAEIDQYRATGYLNEVVIDGSSAESALLGSYMRYICASWDVYWSSSGPGKNDEAYACDLTVDIPGGWQGGPLLVTKRDRGDSIYGVNPIEMQWKEDTMIVDNSFGNCVATNLAPAVDQPS